MTNKIFLDTYLWIYLFSDDDIKKSQVSQLVAENFDNILVSVQVLGELFNVLTKKKITSLDEARQIVSRVSDDFHVLSINKKIVKSALDVKVKYWFSYWDSLLIASALSAQCNTLYTEDLQHNQLIENKLKVVNPLL